MKTRAKKASLMAVITGLMMVLLSSCTSVLEGTVVSKDHYASYEEPYQTCIRYDTENPGLCKQYITQYRTVPERWTVTIQGTNTDGEMDTASYSIFQGTWENTDNGDYMRFDERGNLVEHVEKLR